MCTDRQFPCAGSLLLDCRFTISQNNRVSWLGWQLYVGYLPHYGPRYMDVRFKGQRIAYEVAMQEALACKDHNQQRLQQCLC